MKVIFRILPAIVALYACEHKDLCYVHPHNPEESAKVIFDWQKAPDAEPASMAVYFFSQKGGEALRYDFTDRAGGTVRIPNDTYDALCMNSDQSDIELRNTDRFETFEISTPTVSLLGGLSPLGISSDSAPRAEGTEEERVAAAPQALWCDYSGNLVFDTTNYPHTVTLYPEEVICHYTIEIRNATNLKYTTGLSASISSLSGGFKPGAKQLSDELVTVPFDLTVEQDNTTLTGATAVFGHCASTQVKHQLIVYAVLSDESKWYYTYDVTDQIHSAPDPKNVHILLDGLPLPKPIVNGGGLQPDVDEWQSVDIDIEM